jgi:DNA-binding LacI/PurR family transcriptional regulator
MQFAATQPVYLFAVRQILRFIKGAGLKPGQYLPPDVKLPALVGCSDHAVRGAMSLLARQGVLLRRRRHGTKILNLFVVPPGVWSVGITARPASKGRHLSFEAYLLHSIRARLSEQDVMDRTIIEQYDGFITQESELELLNPHLPMLLREDIIQGVVTCRRIALASAPILHVGAWELATWGVVIDTAAMVRVAIDRIYKSGTKRFAYVNRTKPQPGYNRGYLECINLAGILGMQCETLHGMTENGPVELAAREVSDLVIGMPSRARPRALIFVDDVMAYLVSNLLVSTASYRPDVYAIVNDDTMITFPLKTMVFSVDLDAMGGVAAKEMVSALGGENVANHIVWIEPKEEPAEVHHSIMPRYSVAHRAGHYKTSQHP